MLSFVIGLLCVSSTFSQHSNTNNTNIIKSVAVAVYYESLCPDARAFVTEQLYPALSTTSLGKYINLILYPYGKAKTTKDTNNTYTFVCHHGPDECLGNKYHACALALIDDRKPTEGLGYNNVSLKYVNCLAKTNAQPDLCAAEANRFAGAISRCATGKQGDYLLAEHGNSTNKFQNPLDNVPTITLDDENIKDAEQHFIRELCKKFGDAKPVDCANSGAYAASAAFGVLTIVVAFLFM